MTEQLKKRIRGLLSILRQVYEDDTMSPLIDERSCEDAIADIDETILEWKRQSRKSAKPIWKPKEYDQNRDEN